ncbi:MAG TPA: rod shape-determining protein MreC [Tepidisphaeraceae bacterium]|jgi:cell shape-determining protein MreC|nr:rod shape-determining protein MreC [Tepidisphaeraceae bacterium]
MKQLKFQHVFTALMLVSFVTAFLFPRQTTPRRPQLAGLFAPVSRPASSFGAWFRERFDRKESTDERTEEDVKAENEALRAELVYQVRQLDLLKKINTDRALLGSVREYCTPVRVVGGDPLAARQTLSLSGSSSDGLATEQPVLYGFSVAGRITNAGAAGAQARLITDKGFALSGAFCRYEATPNGGQVLNRINTTPPVLVGAGRNRLTITNLYMKEVEDRQVKIGDWVLLEDVKWPEPLQGRLIGKIVAINPLPSAALHAEIHVEPEAALSRLREVMVMNKEL